MRIQEIVHRLHQDPDIPTGEHFFTNLEGHLVLIEVIKNRNELLNPRADVEIPEPVIEGLEEDVLQEEPQQIEKEPSEDVEQHEDTSSEKN